MLEELNRQAPPAFCTSDAWQQILAIDTRFSHIRSSMRENVVNRNLYLRRRHQLLKEQTRMLQATSHAQTPGGMERELDRSEYKRLREQLIAALYGQATSSSSSSKPSTSQACSVMQSKSTNGSIQRCSSLNLSITDSLQSKSADGDSVVGVVDPVDKSEETVSEGYAFSGIEYIFDHHTGAVNRLCFANNDSTRLAIASADGTVSICCSWPPNEPKRVLHILSNGHQRGVSITDLVWSLSNEFLISTSVDGSVCLWDATKGCLIRQYSSVSIAVGPILVCAYQPQNYNILLVGGAWGAIQTINLSTGKLIKKGRDQVHFAGYKINKYSDSNRFISLGQGCVTALAFDAATGTSLWVGTDRGVIQSYSCQPSTGRLTRAHRLNLSSVKTALSLDPSVENLSNQSHSESKSAIDTEQPVSKGTRILRYNRLALRRLNSVMHSHQKSNLYPGVTSLVINSWLSRESGDAFLLANAAGLGLLLFQVTSPGGLTLKRRFAVPHDPPDPVVNRGLRMLHSTFAPLLSLRSGACAVTASEDCNVYVFDVLRTDKTKKKKSDTIRKEVTQSSSTESQKLLHGLITILQGHTAPVLDVSIGWDESVLASGDERGSVILWRRLNANDDKGL